MAPKAKPTSQAHPPRKTQPSQKRAKVSNVKAKTVDLGTNQSSSLAPAKAKRLDPLTAFSKHLVLSSTPPTASKDSTRSLTPLSHTYKGKGKEKATSPPCLVQDVDGTLWVDRYEPQTEAELAVHVKKVDNVRQWFREAFEGGPSGVFKKYRRILALTGPAGTGKTSTVRVLSRELGFEILEWHSSAGEGNSGSFDRDSGSGAPKEYDASYEGHFTKFEAFLTRASTCHNIFAEPSGSTSKKPAKHVILLEDLPNILHDKTQTQFHEALRSFANSPPSDPPVPLVIIVSDAGMRGEDRDERLTRGGGWGKEKNQVVDVRTVIPKDLLSSAYVAEISFNPVAPTLLRKALQSMLNVHFSKKSTPSKEFLDIIVETSNGDIRSAIMALQFACTVEVSGGKKKNRSNNAILEAVTRREQSLDLFHLIGRVLYNKRKGDPANPSATAKDIQTDRDIDSSLKDPAKLPSHLQLHERRTSRVDIDALYADSPIDSSLFSLYIHQNYTQFCNEVDECAGVTDWLSWVDSSGGEAWYQANPHQFHLLSLGTLHSLPSPVPRRSQKYYKPEFFSFLQKEKEAWDGVQLTKDWFVENGVSMPDSGWRAGGWSRNDLLLELGGILRANDSHLSSASRPPAAHKRFSKMEWSRGGSGMSNGRAQQLNENDQETGELDNDEEDMYQTPKPLEEHGGWLESDDIEEFA